MEITMYLRRLARGSCRVAAVAISSAVLAVFFGFGAAAETGLNIPASDATALSGPGLTLIPPPIPAFPNLNSVQNFDPQQFLICPHPDDLKQGGGCSGGSCSGGRCGRARLAAPGKSPFAAGKEVLERRYRFTVRKVASSEDGRTQVLTHQIGTPIVCGKTVAPFAI